MDTIFNCKKIKPDINKIKEIGFDPIYAEKAIEKHKFISIRICNLSCAQANILKQTALSVGTDCAVHREVITGKVEKSCCILSGSISEIKKICTKLEKQPLNLKLLSYELKQQISNQLTPIKIRNKLFDWNNSTFLMGILNITPDSFSDGGMFNNKNEAIEHYKKLIKEGADIVDIGGESTRPYSTAISSEEEINRAIPILKEIREFDKTTVISIDTRNSNTAEQAIIAGADIINDISACEWDPKIINVAIKYDKPIIINHASSTPDKMQDKTHYEDVVDEIFNYFLKRIELLTQAGVKKENIIIDPGIGFGKTTEQNIEIINRLEELKSLNQPILIGHSRKNFIKEIYKTDSIEDLDIATGLITLKLLEKKVNIVRVHNTKINSVSKISNLFF